MICHEVTKNNLIQIQNPLNAWVKVTSAILIGETDQECDTHGRGEK